MVSAPRVVFFGTPEFAAYILEHLVKNSINVVAAVTTPEKAQGRGLKTRPSAMQDKAKELGLPVRYVGVGEKVGDLLPFNAKDFVNSLFN